MPSSPALVSIVDDDAFVRNALRRLLRSAGYSVEAHSSGPALLQSIQDHVPDCILLDLHMPEMNGFEVQAELRHRGIQAPVVIVTGQGTPERCKRALSNGAFAFICKPIDATDLLAAISGALMSQRA